MSFYKSLTVSFLLASVALNIFTPITQAQTASCFPDVNENLNLEFICKLKADRVVNGYNDGTFGPDNYLSRGEMAKFVSKRFYPASSNSSCPKFPDVNLANTFYDNIMILKCSGVINGYEDGTFGSQNRVTRGEALKFVVNSAIKTNQNKLPAKTGKFYQDFDSSSSFYEFSSAVENNMLMASPDGYVRPNDFMTRSDMARLTQGVFGYSTLSMPEFYYDIYTMTKNDGFYGYCYDSANYPHPFNLPVRLASDVFSKTTNKKYIVIRGGVNCSGIANTMWTLYEINQQGSYTQITQEEISIGGNLILSPNGDKLIVTTGISGGACASYSSFVVYDLLTKKVIFNHIDSIDTNFNLGLAYYQNLRWSTNSDIQYHETILSQQECLNLNGSSPQSTSVFLNVDTGLQTRDIIFINQSPSGELNFGDMLLTSVETESKYTVVNIDQSAPTKPPVGGWLDVTKNNVLYKVTGKYQLTQYGLVRIEATKIEKYSF